MGRGVERRFSWFLTFGAAAKAMGERDAAAREHKRVLFLPCLSMMRKLITLPGRSPALVTRLPR